MMAFFSLDSATLDQLIERAGWLLVHSLWQFAAIALLTAYAMRALRRTSAEVRSGVLLGFMVLLVGCPVATWVLQPKAELTDSTEPVRDVVPAVTSNVAAAPMLGEPLVDQPFVSRPSVADATAVPAEVADGQELSSEVSTLVPVSTVNESAPQTVWTQRLRVVLRPWLAWAVGFWGIGVLLCSLRPAFGWLTLRRLKRVGVSPVSAEVLASLDRICKRIGLACSVRVLQSSLTQVPLVVGYLKPIVLLPVSLLTNIPASQLDAILAHELAHIRRHDFVVNLAQIVVETLFFYHPAVWWLSRRIRVEREHCCDDLVIRTMNNRAEYGRALIAVEELRGRHTAMALGASDGSLLARIRSIAGQPEQHRGFSATSGLLALLFLVVGVVVIGLTAGKGYASGAGSNSAGDEEEVSADEDPLPKRMTATAKRVASRDATQIQWGVAKDGLRMGAAFVNPSPDRVQVFEETDTASVNLYVQNVSHEAISFEVFLRHPREGWGEQILGSDGREARKNRGYAYFMVPPVIAVAKLEPEEVMQLRVGPDESNGSIAEGTFLVSPNVSAKVQYGGPFVYATPPGHYTAKFTTSFRLVDGKPKDDWTSLSAGILDFQVGQVPPKIAAVEPMRPVHSKELRGIYFGKADDFRILLRFIGRQSRVPGQRGIREGRWVVAVPMGGTSSSIAFTDNEATGAVDLDNGLRDGDIAGKSWRQSLGKIERGASGTFYLTTFTTTNPHYRSLKRIPLTKVSDHTRIQPEDRKLLDRRYDVKTGSVPFRVTTADANAAAPNVATKNDDALEPATDGFFDIRTDGQYRINERYRIVINTYRDDGTVRNELIIIRTSADGRKQSSRCALPYGKSTWAVGVSRLQKDDESINLAIASGKGVLGLSDLPIGSLGSYWQLTPKQVQTKTYSAAGKPWEPWVTRVQPTLLQEGDSIPKSPVFELRLVANANEQPLLVRRKPHLGIGLAREQFMPLGPILLTAADVKQADSMLIAGGMVTVQFHVAKDKQAAFEKQCTNLKGRKAAIVQDGQIWNVVTLAPGLTSFSTPYVPAIAGK